ncbi:MAG: replication-associated recombination protein A [Bdellovibrionaceae bacterium]|nr:replication-associated recombination protein A [Pseudobdellovibrionaceae bacterium]
MDLFQQNDSKLAPLAASLRPRSLKEFLGQKKFFKTYSALISSMKKGQFASLVLWGPPGCGKTSFVKSLVAEFSDINFIEENAIDLGAKRLREIGEQGRYLRMAQQKPTLVFIDEIHRLNRSQQDVLLPFVESGDIYLIGATTENPSYELNSALMSRCRLIVFEPLDTTSMEELLLRAVAFHEMKEPLLTGDLQSELIAMSSGDGRTLLNLIEDIITHVRENQTPLPLDAATFRELNLVRALSYDKDKDVHYDCISAFIKSVRGSDPDAAIYYLARMLEGGEDPKFITRRLMILASEDIGNADPNALNLAVSCDHVVRNIGMPEARIPLAQVTVYLASAPKTNSSYIAIDKAIDYVRSTGNLPVPLALRSAKTSLMKSLGYGKGYKYSQDGERGWVAQTFLPDEAKNEKFFEPSERGFEKRMREYLQWVKKQE